MVVGGGEAVSGGKMRRRAARLLVVGVVCGGKGRGLPVVERLGKLRGGTTRGGRDKCKLTVGIPLWEGLAGGLTGSTGVRGGGGGVGADDVPSSSFTTSKQPLPEAACSAVSPVGRRGGFSWW